MKINAERKKESAECNNYVDTIQHGLVGLNNLGNTCFMSSCLQCLFHTLPLMSFFLTSTHDRDEVDSKKKRGRLAEFFGKQLVEYWQEKKRNSSQ